MRLQKRINEDSQANFSISLIIFTRKKKTQSLQFWNDEIQKTQVNRYKLTENVGAGKRECRKCYVGKSVFYVSKKSRSGIWITDQEVNRISLTDKPQIEYNTNTQRSEDESYPVSHSLSSPRLHLQTLFSLSVSIIHTSVLEDPSANLFRLHSRLNQHHKAYS